MNDSKKFEPGNIGDPIVQAFIDKYGAEVVAEDYQLYGEEGGISQNLRNAAIFRRGYPEAYRMIIKLIDSNLSKEDFLSLVEQINRRGNQIAEYSGTYSYFEVPLKVPGRELIVKYYENGRTTVSVKVE